MSDVYEFSSYQQDPDIFYHWTYVGKVYLRNCLNQIYEKTDVHKMRYIGIYDVIQDRIFPQEEIESSHTG
jgi:hypothetical protein